MIWRGFKPCDHAWCEKDGCFHVVKMDGDGLEEKKLCGVWIGLCDHREILIEDGSELEISFDGREEIKRESGSRGRDTNPV